MMETERLRLRRWKESDAYALYEILQDRELCEQADLPRAFTPFMAQVMIRAHLQGAECWCVERKTDNQVLGCVEIWPSVYPFDASLQKPMELAVWFDRRIRQQGYAFEASRRLLEHAFADLKADAVYARTWFANTACIALQEKLEMGEPVKVPFRGMYGDQISGGDPALLVDELRIRRAPCPDPN